MDDQEPGELERLRSIWNIYRAEWLYNHKGGLSFEEWIKAYPTEWETVQDIQEMEVEWPQS